MKFINEFKSAFKIVSKGRVLLQVSAMISSISSITYADVGINALPTNAQIQTGQIGISQTASSMIVNQSSNKGVINWDSCNIGNNASVKFIQPSANASTLNRVVGGEMSQIMGSLSSNGKLVLINPNGVLFGSGSRVDVGGIIATTMDMKDSDYLNDNYHFQRNGAKGTIENLGTLSASQKGYIALLAPEVINEGVVVASMGTIAFGGGDGVTLNFMGDSLIGMSVDGATINTLIKNKQLVKADDGLVFMSAKAASALVSSTISNEGIISASSLVSQGGKIILSAEDITLESGSRLEARGATGGGEILVGGDWQGSNGADSALHVRMQQNSLIDASATESGKGGKVVLWSDVHNAASFTQAQGTIYATGGINGGDGGSIETSGHILDVDNITINAGAPKGKAGVWLLDPTNVTINAALAGTISTALNTTDVEVKTDGTTAGTVGDGNIVVSSAIAKTGAAETTLTLTADNGIDVNANIGSTGGKLNINMTANGNAATVTNSKGLTVGVSGTSVIDANGGTVTLNGTSKNTGGGFPGRIGTTIYGTIKGGSVTINGTSSAASVSNGIGVLFQINSSVEATDTAGTLIINGTANGAGITGGRGVVLGNGGASAKPILKAGGNITINATAPTKSIHVDLGGANITSTTGSILLQGDNYLDIGNPIIVNAALGTTIKTTVGSINAGSGGAIDFTGGLTIDNKGDGTLYNLTGTGGLTKKGLGNLFLASANTFTGTTTIEAGTLSLADANALQNSTLDYSGAGSLLLFANSQANTTYNIGGLSGTKDIAMGTNSLYVGSLNSDTTYSGVLSGTGGITKVGTGIFTLTGNNTYSGTTTISAGTLQVGNDTTTGTLGTGAVTNNGTLSYKRNAYTVINNVITGTGSVSALISSGGLKVNKDITLTGSGSVDLRAENATTDIGVNVSGNIDTTGDVTIIGKTSTAVTQGVLINGKTIKSMGFVTINGTSARTHGVSILGSTIEADGPISITGTAGQGVDLGVIIWQGSTIKVNSSAKDFGDTDAISIRGLTSGDVTDTDGRNVVTNLATITNNSKNGHTSIYGQNSAVSFGDGTVITNSSTAGAIKIVADNDAEIVVAKDNPNTDVVENPLVTITQNSDKGISILSYQQGSVETPTIVNNGTGNVIIGAGVNTVGGGGGQVMTVEGKTLTNPNGKTYIYTGNLGATGNLRYFSEDFKALYSEGQYGEYNAAFSKVNGDTITSNGANSQVLFRAGASDIQRDLKPVYTLDNTDATFNKVYGDADPTLTVLKDALISHKGSTTTLEAEVGGNIITTDVDIIVNGLTGAERIVGENVGLYAYTGFSNSNYNLNINGSMNLAITKKDITLTAMSANNKTYDGTTVATVTSGTLNGLIGSETLNISGTGTFDNANIGTRKTVTADVNALTKTDGTGLWSNYNLVTTSATTTADITATTPTYIAPDIKRHIESQHISELQDQKKIYINASDISLENSSNKNDTITLVLIPQSDKTTVSNKEDLNKNSNILPITRDNSKKYNQILSEKPAKNMFL